jgi:hypothetical protein
MNPLDFIPKIALVAALVALGVFAGWQYMDATNAKLIAKDALIQEEQIRNDNAKMVLLAQQAQIAAQDKARAAEYELQTRVTEQQRITNEKVSALTDAANALKLRLAKARTIAAYPASPSSAPAPAADAAVASGGDQPVLSPTVGGLVDEARRAELIRLNLLNCYDQYDAAREALK